MLVGPNLKEDYLEIKRLFHTPKTKVTLLAVLILALKNRGFRAVALHRMARFCRLHGLKLIAYFLEHLSHHICFAKLPGTAEIGPGLKVLHPKALSVGVNIKAGRQLQIAHEVHIGGNMGKKRADGSGQPILGDNVQIGAGGMVFGPVEIGDNVLIGAGTIVTYDVPSNCVVARSPSFIVRKDGKSVSLLDGPENVELCRILRDLKSRVEALEAKVAGSRDLATGQTRQGES